MARLKDMDYVIIDLETTGLYVDRGDKIIEIGAVRMKGTEVYETQTFQTLVNPEMELSAESTAVNGITNEDVKGQPTILEVAPKLEEFISGAIPIAQNARFDLGFLRVVAHQAKCARLHVPYLDTMLVSKTVLFHYTTGHNLDAIAKRLNVASKWDRHRSVGDCLLTAHVWAEMIRQLELHGKTMLKDVENCFVTLPKVEVPSTTGQSLSLF